MRTRPRGSIRKSRRSWRRWTQKFSAIPRACMREGRRARGEIDSARDTVAAWLGAKPSEIIFTSGGTESCNLAVLGLARAHRSRGRHLITATTEHHAVLHAFSALEKREGFAVTLLPVDRAGRIDPSELDRSIRPETVLVSIMSANNETGVRQPMRELGAVCAKRDVLFSHRRGAERRQGNARSCRLASERAQRGRT